MLGYNTSEHNTSWSHVDVYGGPSTRVGHSATLYNEEFYLFGGIDLATGEYKNDLWKAEVVGMSTLLHQFKSLNLHQYRPKHYLDQTYGKLCNSSQSIP